MVCAELNIFDGGSTGKIMLQIAEKARSKGNVVYTVSNIGVNPVKTLKLRNNKYHLYFNGIVPFALHYKIGGFLGLNGLLSILPTIRVIYYLKKWRVELIHLHNLHQFCFNLPILFWFIKKHRIPVIWTLHDCWSFTGRCPYFDMTKCDKWKTGCHSCPYPKATYPHTYIDTSNMMWKKKKKWFSGIEKCVLVTPSQWLANLVKQSFLCNYPVKVINNGIDLFVFKPMPSDFRESYGLTNKKIVLGVAFGWGARKGLDVFIELAHRLPDCYQIVLVGTNCCIDKMLPPNVISIHRTQDQIELAKIYTAADVFVNPTREETLGMVNIEALACGTPVVTFKTGGSPECVDDSCGVVVERDDVDSMELEICRICKERPFSERACVNRAKLYDMNDKYEEYVALYAEMNRGNIQ